MFKLLINKYAPVCLSVRLEFNFYSMFFFLHPLLLNKVISNCSDSSNTGTREQENISKELTAYEKIMYRNKSELQAINDMIYICVEVI